MAYTTFLYAVQVKVAWYSFQKRAIISSLIFALLTFCIIFALVYVSQGKFYCIFFAPSFTKDNFFLFNLEYFIYKL